jgi:hypothetical protein
VADRKRTSEDIAARVVVAAGKEVGKKALDRVLPPDETDADEDGDDKPKRKRRGWLIAGGIAALLVVIGVIGLVMAYWQWFLLAGVLGLAGIIGYYRVRRRFSSKKKKNKNKSADGSEAASTRVEREAPKRRVAEDKDEETAAAKARAAEVARARELEAARDAAAEREAREREVDEELAAMKARIKTER